jgi:hypothetical protein
MHASNNSNEGEQFATQKRMLHHPNTYGYRGNDRIDRGKQL